MSSGQIRLFDNTRNPFDDLQKALDYAKVSQKNILIEVGGDWCSWCHTLEKFITSHRELYEMRSLYFVYFKVFIDEHDDTNAEFLQRMPPVEGVPHYFVYDPRGKFLHSQPTDPLEEGDSYSYDRIFAFFTEWGFKTNPNERL